MASQPIANLTIDWSAKNLAHEYKTFTKMCKLMFSGPYNFMDNDMVQNFEPCNMKLTAFNKTDINVIGQKHLVTKHNGLQKNIL